MKISDRAFQWKMRFNPDRKKQAEEVIFRRKNNKIDHPPLYFSDNLVKSSSTHKHLGMILDTKLDFSLHLKNVQGKQNNRTYSQTSGYFTLSIVNYYFQIIYKASP